MTREELRGWPCNIATDDLWCVCGEVENGGGVLEWCDGEHDAHAEVKRLSRDPRYRRLSARRTPEAPR